MSNASAAASGAASVPQPPVPPAKSAKKKERKAPNTYVILFLIIAFIAVLTWFIPGGAYKTDDAGRAIAGTFQHVKAAPQGLWDVFMAPITGMLGSKTISAAIPISLFVMLFGSFLEMMDRTGALRIGLRRVALASQGRLLLLIAVLVTIMSIMGTIEGAYEEGVVYLLMFMPILLVMGLDTVTAAMIVVVGTQVGCLASTINPFGVGIASGIAGVSVGDGMGMRAIMFVVFTAVAIAMIYLYARRVQANPSRSMQHFRRDDDIKEFAASGSDGVERMVGRQKAALCLFIATFAIMVVSLIPWTSLNSSWTFFGDIAAWIAQTPVLREVLGSDITPMGTWYFAELSMMLLVMTFIIGKVMGYDANKNVDIIIAGAANLVPTALIVAMARGIQVVMDDGKITPTILHMGEDSLSSLPPVVFAIVALVFYFLIACLIPSSSGLAAATMGIMASLARFANIPEPLMVTIFGMALGLAKMVTPTSIVLMTCLQAAHISYARWLRFIWLYVVALFALCCVFLIVAVLI
ncbi:YfcC family protein [Devriesea agamarum]|uniref:YfcC family protein n=1 Tax=Devriesea agamarum TaxID=472569 RepID=UPI0009FE435B|nr:YfcC family protein [Devriesea agamarum]